VRDQDAKATILDALNAVFGADKVKSAISIDPSATAASLPEDTISPYSSSLTGTV